ncbi:polysaccharide pyruvyl transferase family protein [Cellulophaga sp. Asnod2-G02]|uniref:polysaccharide pyruvyl transferase family protein n=1 Tax=Cellulophaga sp. Asnod2-G02 TaxID=3160572 RepID=UPI00386D1A8A
MEQISKLLYKKNYFKGYLRSRLKKINQPDGSEKYHDFGILNPGIGTSNLGDLIIYDSVYGVLREVFPEDMFTNYPTQLHTSFDAKKMMSEKELLFVSGTNLLSSNLEDRNQWKVDNSHKRFLNNKVVLFGTGWWQYQENINKYSEKIYKKVLSKDVLHSVRDSYAAEKLHSIGLKNVVNTTCPTLWKLTPDKCKTIPTKRAKTVVTTLTFYHANEDQDYRMLKLLDDNYEKVYLWIQGMNDYHYYNKLNKGFKNIEFISPTIEAYNSILDSPDIDYIGTRLHAGVRALQRGVRTLILAVDNRALEIGKDVNLNVIKRENAEQALDFINNEYITDIKLPTENINMFINSLKKHIK